MTTSRRWLPVVDADAAERAELRGDCARCAGLCCVALPFTASADFAVDKDAGVPCAHLGADYRCRIHDRLRAEGFRGCVVYDCFGAGQQVCQHIFGGSDWRENPEHAREMFAVFPVVRQLHELLWYLDDALSRSAAARLHADLAAARDRIAGYAAATPPEVADVDVAAVRDPVAALLRRVSKLVRSGMPEAEVDHNGADLMGARLSGARLRGACLRNACLIGAKLTRADLRCSDVIGADLRDADLSGADLRGCLYCTQPQLNAAQGDEQTRLPGGLDRPAHWAAER